MSLNFSFVTSCFVPDKSLKDTLDKVLMSGYFDRAQTHQNGTCQEEEEQEEQTAVAESNPGEQPSEPGRYPYINLCEILYLTHREHCLHFSASSSAEGLSNEKFTEPIKVETTEVRTLKVLHVVYAP